MIHMMEGIYDCSSVRVLVVPPSRDRPLVQAFWVTAGTLKLELITIFNHIVKGLPGLLLKEKFGLKSMVIGMTLFLLKTQILKDDS